MDLDVVVLSIAWLVTLAWCVIEAPRVASRARPDAAVCAGLVTAALLVRLALPWGPLSFAEAERLQVLWGSHREYPPTFDAIPVLLSALRSLHVPVGVLVRWAGPVLGSLGVGMAFLVGRAGGLGRPAAALGAAVLLGFPPYVHFSTSVGFSVEGPALWTAAFAAALAVGLDPRWRVALVAALTVLGVHARPEYRLLGLALLPVVFAPHWTARQRVALALSLALGLGSYVRYLRVANLAGSTSGLSQIFAPWVVHDLGVNAPWWLAAGALGLVLGRMRWPLRVALTLSTALIVLVYWALASDYNPLWGQWRYYVTLSPFVAVAVGALGERLPERPWRAIVLTVVAVLAGGSVLAYLPVLRRHEDLPMEFAYLRATAPAMLRAHPTVLLLANRRRGEESRVLAEGTPLLALGTTLGPVNWARRCDDGASPSHPALDVRDLEEWTLRCPTAGGFDPTRAVVYLGLFRPEARLAAVTARWRLVPLDERTERVAPSVPAVDSACPVAPGTLEGSATPDCPVRFGWYRLVPRGG